jgi:RimJ/RimL family protein N-acetyltransferase
LPELVLRRARPADCRLVWRIRNEETARAASLSGDPIPFEAHERWWRRTLEDPSALVYIASPHGGSPSGYVRFALEDDQATISIALAPSARGRGFGTAAIRAGCAAVLASGTARRIVALVKPGNEASLRAFLRAGFVERPRSEAASGAVELVLEG